MKKTILLLLFLAVLILGASLSASADTVGGACGDTYNDATGEFDNATWSFDTESGTLTISGNGKMGSWSWDGMPWYAYRNQIRSVVIEDGITHVSGNSFPCHTAMTEIHIPPSVVSMGGSYSVFDQFNALEAVYITDLAAWCGIDFHFSSINNPLSYAKDLYLGGALVTELKIPEGVTSIRPNAFHGCTSIESAELPQSLQSIESNAFAGCTALTEVKIPAGVRRLGRGAFASCSALIEKVNGISYVDGWVIGCDSGVTEAILREGTVGMAEYSLGSNVSKLHLPSSLRAINGDAIPSNYLTEVHITDLAAWFEIDFGMSLIASNCALYLNDALLTDLTVPEGVTSIGARAFANCRQLTSVTLPSSLLSIGDGAFSYCGKLKSVEGLRGTIGDRAFKGCTSLKTIDLAEGVVSIGEEAFYDCSALESVTFPRSLSSIGKNAFNFCAGLKSVHLTDLYAWCKVQICDNNSLPSYGAVYYLNGARITELELPDGVTAVGDYAFFGFSDLTSVILPDSVASIGKASFSRCRNLQSIRFPKGLISIGESAFSGCSALANAAIPSEVIEIGAYAFSGCSSLTSIELPKGINAIENDTFSNCDSLTEIRIPQGVTRIGRQAFLYCGKLLSVSIPDSVTSIEESAFKNCKKLQTIVYCGTENQWNSVKKGDYWLAYASSATVSYHHWNGGEIAEAHSQTASGKLLFTCEECGETRTESIGHSYGKWEPLDEDRHQKLCSCGGSTTAKHTFSNDRDAICNDCDHTRELATAAVTTEEVTERVTEPPIPAQTEPSETSEDRTEDVTSEQKEEAASGCRSSAASATVVLFALVCAGHAVRVGEQTKRKKQ